MKKRKIKIPPKTNIVEVLAKTGGTIAQNLMELVDNSYDAMFDYETGEQLIKKQNIAIDWGTAQKGKLKGRTGWLVIDEASGILNPDSVWVYGASNKKRNLGKFGVGLKISVTSLGNEVWIETSTSDSNQKTIIEYNHKNFIEKNIWETDAYDDKEESHLHYTHVFITGCHDENPDFDSIRAELSRTYYKLCNNNVIVLLNDEELQWSPPEIFSTEDIQKLRETYGLPDKPRYGELYREFDIFIKDKEGIEHKISGWVGIQKEHNLENDGVDIFRANRLIESNSSIGIGQMKNRIYGQLEIGYDFPVNFHKTAIDKSDPLTKKLDNKLEKEVKHIVNVARFLQSSQKRKIPANVKKWTNLNEQFLSNALRGLRNIIKDLMEEFPVYQETAKEAEFGEIDKKLTESLTEEQKKRLKKSILTHPRERKPLQGFRDPVTGERIKLQHIPDNLGEDMRLSNSDFMRGTLSIFTNMDHPLYVQYEKYFTSRQLSEMYLQNMIFEIARFFSTKYGLDRDEMRDKIQRLYSRQDLSKLKN